MLTSIPRTLKIMTEFVIFSCDDSFWQLARASKFRLATVAGNIQLFTVVLERTYQGRSASVDNKASGIPARMQRSLP
jgi:hypothetical protein